MSESELAGLSPSAKHAFRAVRDGDLTTLKRFLGSVDINRARNVSGRTLLHVACLSGDRLVVAELLRAGADPCACDEVNGSTPLHLTVFKTNVLKEGSEIVGSVAITRMLLRAGANVDAKDAYGETPLHDAVSARRCGCIAELLKAGANVNARSGSILTPLDKTFVAGIASGSPRRVWPLLLMNGGVANAFPMDSMMDQDGFEYIRKIVTAGGFAAHAKAHRARLVTTLVPKFIRIPADNIPLVVDFWAHVGFY